MEIIWYGHSCFRISERGMANVVTDPYDHTKIGYSELALRADIVTISQDQPGYNNASVVKGAKWTIDGPGEYEIGGVFITAVPTGKNNKNGGERNMVYVFDYDSVTVCHLGNLKSVPSRKEVDAFGSVDVLLVPVGGGDALVPAKAAEVVNLIEPNIVIPMKYSTPASKVELGSLETFYKQMGLDKAVEPEESIKLGKRDIPEETRVVALKYQH